MSVGDFSFTYRERLHTASQFQRVFNQATRSSSEMFTLLARENTVGYPRLGMVVAKRHAKRAVDRNTVKRIIRESFRMKKTELSANDYVVILKRPVRPVLRDRLGQQLTGLWEKCTKA